jgi:hypothetical protein
VSRRVRSLLAIAGALALASLSACASYTPSAVENRVKLPSCGEYENRNEPYSPEQLRKNRCILDALDQGRQAELIRTLHGIDGGPHIEYLRVLGAGRIEVFVDATRDVEYGGPEARWSHWLCHDLQETNGYLERLGCREIGLDDS